MKMIMIIIIINGSSRNTQTSRTTTFASATTRREPLTHLLLVVVLRAAKGIVRMPSSLCLDPPLPPFPLPTRSFSGPQRGGRGRHAQWPPDDTALRQRLPRWHRLSMAGAGARAGSGPSIVPRRPGPPTHSTSFPRARPWPALGAA